MSKRLFDCVVAAVGLLVLLPLLLAIAVWVKLDSPGPVWFRQVRVGRFGREFRIHKFRTMHVDAPAMGPAITAATDPRITRAGALLRRHKLDELPQLFDVLVGSMSLVGPRPEVPKYVSLYPDRVREIVLSVRPGITDDAAIEFSDEGELLARAKDPEAAYVNEILPRKIEHYVRYVGHRTLLGDLRIIGRTIRRLAGERGSGQGTSVGR
jgi:lipopolysaccharide/colanic/teichoic acid biosynthesis glycosyltransferase